MKIRKGVESLINIPIWKNKRAQVTIFIIIALVLIAGTVVFFQFKDSIFQQKIPSSFEPIYNNFLYCLEKNSLFGISLLESQAGYIELPEFESGSSYAPFSSQLDFLGNPVPYWYYVSGNNIQKEQIPSKALMEKQLASFIESKIYDCDFESYYEDGFELDQGEAKATVSIQDSQVKVNLNFPFVITKAGETTSVNSHELSVKSNLGSLYDSAREVYSLEQKDLFLENYAVDTLRLYAPVDGLELSCSPKMWEANAIFTNLSEAIEANTLALKAKTGDYVLTDDANKYFITDVSSDHGVRFINSKNWVREFEVDPSEGNILIANPVGNQQGLGILGFCYVPYHFVYNVNYPVLIQVYEGEETFQFPVAVVLKGNKPREALKSSAVDLQAPEICKYQNSEISVKTYDTNLNPIDANISYECLGETCQIGITNSNGLNGLFPQCVNGYVVAKARGFLDAKVMYSSVNEGNIEIILDRVYNLDIDLNLDGKDYNGNAMINFVSDGIPKTIAYPEQETVELAEGDYNISVYVYQNSSIELGATTIQQCVDSLKGGVLGLLGMTEKQCFDVDIPEQMVTNALAGGGSQSTYLLESSLRNSKSIIIDAPSFPVPRDLNQIQNNYLLFEDKELNVYLR